MAIMQMMTMKTKDFQLGWFPEGEMTMIKNGTVFDAFEFNYSFVD